MLIGDFLNHLTKVKKQSDGSFLAICPAHSDTHPSLHISQEDDRLLLKCQAGCQTETIIERLGLTMADLFPKEKIPRTIVATYDYQDEEGQLLFQVVRYDPKSFAQRHKNSNGEWAWDTKNVRKVIYHLPDILRVPDTDIIYFVEGEKDADALWDWGLVATTTPGGCQAWRPEYALPLAGKRIVILPDNDSVGKAYSRQVAKSLQDKARSLSCIILPDARDISDWLEKGNNIAELPSLEQDISALFAIQTPQYQKDGGTIKWIKDDYIYEAQNILRERTGVHARLSISQEYQPLAWTVCNIDRADERIRLANQVKKNDENIRQSLDIFCAGLWEYYISADAPEMMMGEDTLPPSFYLFPYILQSGGTILFSPPGRGKSFSALLWAQSINIGISTFWKVQQSPVLYINLERSSQSLRRRLAAVNRVLGLPASTPLLTFNRRGQPLSALAPNIAKAVEQYGIRLIVLDSISRAGFGDLTENRPVTAIIDTLSNLCQSWLALGHTPRSDEGHIYGSIHFEAGADIVIQLSSEPETSKLGVKYEIVKSNDLPPMPEQTWSFEFEEWNLKSIEKAKPFEFAELEKKHKPKMLPSIIDFILNQDSADASASQVANELGYNRVNVSDLLSKSGKFIKTRKIKHSQYYGMKEV